MNWTALFGAWQMHRMFLWHCWSWSHHWETKTVCGSENSNRHSNFRNSICFGRTFAFWVTYYRPMLWLKQRGPRSNIAHTYRDRRTSLYLGLTIRERFHQNRGAANNIITKDENICFGQQRKRCLRSAPKGIVLSICPSIFWLLPTCGFVCAGKQCHCSFDWCRAVALPTTFTESYDRVFWLRASYSRVVIALPVKNCCSSHTFSNISGVTS